MNRYQVVKYDPAFRDSSQESPIVWRLSDITWLDRVLPDVAKNWRASTLDYVDRRPLDLSTEANRIVYEAWSQMTDGLLGSQKTRYKAFLDTGVDPKFASGETNSRPWYFDYLDKVMAIGNPTTS